MIFLLAHIAVLLWAAFVIWIAAVTNQAALIGLFFCARVWDRFAGQDSDGVGGVEGHPL